MVRIMRRLPYACLAAIAAACGSSESQPPNAEPPQELDLGFELYTRHCSSCHGYEAVSSSLPDLRRASQETLDNWVEIVLEGSNDPMKMPAFRGKLSAEQALMIRDYVLRRRAEDAQ